MRSETFHSPKPLDGGLSEVLLGIVGVLAALIGLGLAIDIDLIEVLSGLAIPAHIHTLTPSP